MSLTKGTFYKLNIPIEQIAQAVELTEKEVEEILKTQEN